MDTIPDGFGHQLKALRLAAGLTQESLAERAGISSRAVSDLERDPHRAPRLDTVALVSEALALSPAQRAALLAAARPTEPEAFTGRQPMPRPLTPVIGRAGVTAALVDLLVRGETPLLTLTGPGGVGKTRLALDVVAAVADRFADGAVFVDLAPLRDPGLVALAVARQLGIDEHARTPVSDRLSAALRDKQVLILLDNLEHLLEARTDLLALLVACPGVRAVVTSRVPLRVRGEREYRIAPLEVSRPGAREPGGAPADALFAACARAVGVELAPEEAPTVAEICRRLEGLPLAIELAAARTRLFGPRALLERLGRRLPMLVGGAFDLPDRQKTMRDAIAWSYHLLSEPGKDLFRVLAVFSGGCTHSTAASLSGDPAFVDTLTELVDASLVGISPDAAPPRIVMLETVREYGLERQHAANEAAAIAREHAAYFLAVAEHEAVDVVATERDNLRAALDWALTDRDAPTALRLCGSLGRLWLERGPLDEGLARCRAALALPGSAEVSADVRLAALTVAVKLAIAMSCDEEARTWSEELVDLARRDGSARALAVALNARGVVARTQDRYAEAARDHREAAGLAESSPGRAEYGEALIGLSFAMFFTGASARAEALAEQGLAAAHASGDRRCLADALLLLAWQSTHAGKYESAHQRGLEAVAVFRELKDSGKLAESLRVVGTNAQISGQYERAAVFLEESHALFAERGEEQLAGELLAHLAHIALVGGELAHARQLGTRALISARKHGDQWGTAMAATVLGHIEVALERIDAARVLFAESAELFGAIGNPLYLAWCFEGSAAVAVADEGWSAAAWLCAAREAVLGEIGAELPPMHPAAFARTLVAVEDALGAEGMAAAGASVRNTPLAALIAAVGVVPGRPEDG